MVCSDVREKQGSAAKSGLLQIGDEIESIDGQSVSRLNSSSVGEMIRGRSGTQVVLDVFSGKGKLRTRVGITRAPLEQQPEVSTPINHLKMAVTSYTAMTSPQQPASTTHLNACAEPVLPNPPVDSKNNANNCGVGMAFEFNPAGGLLVLRKIADGIQSPFAVGDCLTQINGTSVTSNAMLAPSLIWGEAGSTVKIKMVRNGDVPQFIEARLVRKPTVMDANLIMSGGGKTCGIGVVLEVEARSRCFYVKRVIHGGPAFSAGVSQGDLVTHIDNKDLRLYTKDQLPGLILGPEGSMLTLQLMRAGESNARQLVITRFLDTAKAQQSNLAATALLNFDCMETINRQLDGVDFSSALQVEIVTALRTVSKRVQIANVSFKDGSASVIILPDFEGGDTRSVEELVRDLVYESSNQRSTLRKNHVCGSLSKITILGHVDLQTSPRNVLREDASQASNDTQNAMPSERGGINSIPLQLPSVNKPPPMDSDDVSSTLLPLRQCLSPRVLNVEKAAQPAKVPFMESRRLSPQGQSSDNGKGLHALQTGGNSIALSAEHVEAEQTLEKKTIGAEQDDGRVQMPVPSSETLAEKSDARDDLLIAKMPAACNGDQLVADESAKNARMAPGHSQFVACSDGQDQNAESFPIIDDKITMGVVDKHVSSSVVNTNLNNGIPSEMMSSRSKTVDALAEKADVNGGDKIVIDVVQQQVSNAVALSAMPKDIPSESCVVSEPLTVAPALATSAPKGEDVVMLDESTSRSLDAAVKQLSESVKTPVHQAGMATKTFPVLPAPQFISASGSALEIIDALDPSILGSPNDPSEDPWEDCTPLRHFNSEALCESEEELAIRENLQALQAMGVFDRDDQAPNRTSSSTTCPKGGNAPCTANPAPTQASAEESRGVPPAESDRKDAAPLHILKAISAQQTAVSAVTAVRLNIAPEEVKGLQEKFPHRIPVVLSKAEFSIAPEMQGNKYLVPLNITTRNFYSLVTKRIEGVPAGMHLVFSVAGTPILDNGSIQNLWETHQNCDGILHVTYDVVEGEISLSQDVDEPLDQASLVTCPAEQLTLPANLTTEPGIGAADALADQLKNWVTLDSFKPPVVEQGGCEESLAPPSLFNALGNNLLQMVMPSPQAQAQTQMKPSDSNKLHSVKTSETSLVQPSQPQQQKEHLAGIGLKIERDVNGKGFRIVGVAPDGPSANTVMKLNDYLIAIDGRDISDMRTAAVAGLLKGPEGSTVQLTLRMPRGGGQATHKITLTRATVARHGPDADRADEGEEKTVAPSPAKNGDKLNIFGFSF
jgi:GABA(A) receptor-associated protein